MARPSLGTLAALAVCVLFPAACQAADAVASTSPALAAPSAAGGPGLWLIYDQALRNAKYNLGLP